MSKRNQIKQYVERQRPFFVTESGITVHVKPIEMDAAKLMEDGLAEDYRASGKPIDAPEIEVDVAGGKKVKRPLTEKNLFVEGDETESARRIALWTAHTEAVEAMKFELGQLTIEYLLDGIDEQLPEDESWMRRFERLHIKVPADLYDRLIFYKRHVLIVTPGDYGNMQAEIAVASSSGTLDREEVEAEVATFLDKTRIRLKGMAAERTSQKVTQGQVEA